jgi:hypothetical protein
MCGPILFLHFRLHVLSVESWPGSVGSSDTHNYFVVSITESGLFEQKHCFGFPMSFQ